MRKDSTMKRALDRFGLKMDDIPLPDRRFLDKKLEKGESREIVLSADSPLGGTIRKVQCFDLDEVKNMIGVKNELARRKKSRRFPNVNLNLYSPAKLERNYDEGKLTFDQHQFIKSAGRAYVFGDSDIVKDFKRVIEKTHTRGAGSFDLTIACFGNIWILNGWSLVLTPSIQSFCANALLLEPNAQVIRKGNADINFNIGEIRTVEPQLPI